MVFHTCTFTYIHTYIYILIYIYISIYIYIKLLVTIAEDDPKAHFLIATTLRCKGGNYSFLWISPLYP